MSTVKLHPLCLSKCKRKKCIICQKCTHKSCPRPDWKCTCNDGNGTNASNDLLTENVVAGVRSNKWVGNIIPGIDVPTIPLPSLNLYNTSKKEIDKTVPNLFDNSISSVVIFRRTLLVLASALGSSVFFLFLLADCIRDEI